MKKPPEGGFSLFFAAAHPDQTAGCLEIRQSGLFA
jgi:hypothetical protein